jgi:5-methylcytosine-specific restriction enzyme A
MTWQGNDRRDRLPPNWTAIRARVFALHGDICHVCGEAGADGVDHVQPGDDHRLANLRPIHHHGPPYCHRGKSAQEGVAARAQLRLARYRPRERHPGAVRRDDDASDTQSHDG